MLAAIAEFEHDLIVERTQNGLAAARARARQGGLKFEMAPTLVKQARAMYDTGDHRPEIADTFGVSRPTIYRDLNPTRATCTQGNPNLRFNPLRCACQNVAAIASD